LNTWMPGAKLCTAPMEKIHRIVLSDIITGSHVMEIFKI
jgi:hypothetical protein